MKNKAIIIGAGISGLSTAWKLSQAGYQVQVIEKNEYIGGMSSTFKYKDYSLDYGPHKIFTVMDHIMQEILLLFTDDPLLSIHKQSHIRLQGKYLSYPVGIKDVFTSIGISRGLNCGLGYLNSIVNRAIKPRQDNSYEDWVINRFGRPTYELVLGPYARKIWGNPQELSKDLAETRIAMPSLMEMIKQMLFGKKDESPVINAEFFFYPPQGFVQISQKMLEKIQTHGGIITLGKALSKIECDHQGLVSKIIYSDGSNEELHENDALISTAPLQQLVAALNPLPNANIIQALSRLRTRKLILLYIVLNAKRLTEDNWLFFPEEKYPFNRIFEQKGFNVRMVPDDKTVLCAEITCTEHDPLWQANDEQIYSESCPGLKEAGLLDNEIIEYFVKRVENAYPVYDLYYKENLNLVMDYLDTIPNLYSIGRQGCYSYAGMADCMDMGISTAKFIINASSKTEEWNQYRQKFYEYVVVD